MLNLNHVAIITISILTTIAALVLGFVSNSSTMGDAEYIMYAAGLGMMSFVLILWLVQLWTLPLAVREEPVEEEVEGVLFLAEADAAGVEIFLECIRERGLAFDGEVICGEDRFFVEGQITREDNLCLTEDDGAGLLTLQEFMCENA